MALQRLHSRLNGFLRRLVAVESLVLDCLLPVGVRPVRLALFAVILPRSLLLLLPHHYLFQVQYYLVNLQQQCGTRVEAHQRLEQSGARKPFCRQVAHSMVDLCFGHVGLTRSSEVVILVDGLVVVAALVAPSDSADTEEMMM